MERAGDAGIAGAGLSAGKTATTDGLICDEGLRLDLLVDKRVLCEIKAVNTMAPVFQAQVLTYLKPAGRRQGLPINFDVPRIKEGIQRVVL